jgi:hypothetical protein
VFRPGARRVAREDTSRHPIRESMFGSMKVTAPLAPIMAIALIACSSYRPPPPASAPLWERCASASFLQLADELRAQWFWVARQGVVSPPYFSVDGEVLQVEHEAVLVFTYPDEEARARESATIAEDASRIGSYAPQWTSPPTIWTGDDIIVIQLGDDEAIAGALTRILGPPRHRGADS